MLANLNLTRPNMVSYPDADGHFNPFPAYPFTGSLRPVYPLSPRRTVPDRVGKPDYAGNGIPASEQVSKEAAAPLWILEGNPGLVDPRGDADRGTDIRREEKDHHSQQEGAGCYAESLPFRPRGVGHRGA